MWICINTNSAFYASGNTPEMAFKGLCTNQTDWDQGDPYFEECHFYQVDKPIPMEQKIIPQQVIVESTTRSKK